jgi:hypothetical protein
MEREPSTLTPTNCDLQSRYGKRCENCDLQGTAQQADGADRAHLPRLLLAMLAAAAHWPAVDLTPSFSSPPTLSRREHPRRDRLK